MAFTITQTQNYQSYINAANEQRDTQSYGVPIPIVKTFPVATGELDLNDVTGWFLVPPGHYVLAFQPTASDLDSNVSPAVVLDFVLTDSSGTVTDTLISGSTIGQAGGSDDLDAGKMCTYAGGKYIGFKVATAPATAQAGTIRMALLLSRGVIDGSATVVGTRGTGAV